MDLKVQGKEHVDTLTIMYNIAALYVSQARFGEGEVLFKEIVALREKVVGKEHPHTNMAVNEMVKALEAQSKYNQADELLQIYPAA